MWRVNGTAPTNAPYMRFPQEQHREHNNWLFLPGDNAIPFFPSAAVCIPNPTVVALRLPFPFDSPANTQIKDSKDQHKQGKSHCPNGNRHLFAINRKQAPQHQHKGHTGKAHHIGNVCKYGRKRQSSHANHQTRQHKQGTLTEESVQTEKGPCRSLFRYLLIKLMFTLRYVVRHIGQGLVVFYFRPPYGGIT